MVTATDRRLLHCQYGSIIKGSLHRSTYATTGASDPAPVVEFATELGDQVGGVLGVRRLDQVVVVILDLLSYGAM